MTNARQPVTAEITEAFLALMVEKPFIDITVTDIVRKAGVARASFYRNFSSTSEILENVLNNVTEQFREYVLPVVTGNDQRKWREFLFRHIYFISDRQQKIISSRSSNLSILLSKMSDISHELSGQQIYKDIREKYSISSRLAVINSVIMRWINDGRKETPEEIVDYLMSFILTI